MFKIIACINKKGSIGNNGKLLYHIKNDINNFSRITQYNGVVIMGRKTFESLPNKEPLKNRVNIIITSNDEYCIDKEYEDVYIVNSIESAIELCNTVFSDRELFVIGGESIYRGFMERGLVSEMMLTVVDDDTKGDAFFPQYDENEWYLYYKSPKKTSEKNGLSFYFQVLRRIKNNGE